MAKIAHPVAHELGITRRKLDEATQQLAAARAEIEVLKDEVARLRQHVPPEFKMQSQLPSQSTLPSDHKRIQSSIPRYARATQASDQRSAKLTTQPQNQTTTFGTVTLTIKSARPAWNDPMNCTRAPYTNQYQYRDGSLVRVPTGYLKSTKSSRAKLCPKIPRRSVKPGETPTGTQLERRQRPWWEEGECGSVSNDDRWTRYEPDEFRKPWSLWWVVRMYRSPLKLADTEYRDLMDLIALLPATRLEDDELQKTSLKHMLIEDGQQARLVVRGRELAQKCLWNFAEEHIPGQNPWTTWQQVRFEWGVLVGRLGGGGIHHSFLQFRASQPDLVWDTIQKVITLRHTTSHYSDSSSLFPFRLDEVDKHLKNVQKMAIQLYDKTGALQARKLRDELRQAAHDTFDEITALGPLVALPFAGYPWKPHHESVFIRLVLEVEDVDAGRKLDEYFPKEIGRIAEDWLWQGCWRGGRYEPPVSLAACRRTPPKRRHSASTDQVSETVLDLVARIKADREWQQRYSWDTPYDVPEWLIKAHEEGVSVASPRARRRLSHSS